MTTTRSLRSPSLRRLGVAVRRRWPIVIVCTLLGLAGAALLSSRAPAQYLAEAVVVVPAVSADDPAPGSPDAAAKLASTYATLIPLDDAVIDAAAKRANVDPTDLRKSLTVSSDPGTALIRIDVLDSKAIVAVDSATAMAVVLTRPTPPGQIAKDSLKLVTVPTSATRMGESSSSSLAIGGILGLIVGMIAAAALERSDRRIDSEEELASILGQPATTWVRITPAEARALAFRWRALAGVDEPEVAVVATAPMTQGDVKAMLASLGSDVDGSSGNAAVASGAKAGKGSARPASQEIVPAGTGAGTGAIGVVAVGAPGSGEEAELRAQTSDLVVLVVRQGTRAAVVDDAIARLAEYGVTVMWGLLAPRPARGSAAVEQPA